MEWKHVMYDLGNERQSRPSRFSSSNITDFDVSLAEFTSAIGLVVEIIIAEQFVSAFLKSAFPPVLFPECHVGKVRRGPSARLVDLFNVFPPGGCQGGGEPGETIFGGVAGGLAKPPLKAA